MSMFSEITNPFIATREQIRRSDGSWGFAPNKEEVQKQTSYLGRAISGEGTSILTSFGRPTTIQHLEIALQADNPTVFPLLYIDQRHDGNYNSIFHVITKRGRSNPTPGLLDSHYHTHLGVELNEAGDAKVYLKKPLYLPQGCRLVLKGFDGEDSKATYKMFWTEVVEND